MKIGFYGAAQEVTGSCYYLEVNGKHILVDCGMYQGHDKFPRKLPLAAYLVDYVFLTHAHIDHSGRLPVLAREGFKGEVHCTNLTAKLCNIMLKDSAHIQEMEAEWQNRKAQRKGDLPFEPMYTTEDANQILSQMVPHAYHTMIDICEGVKIRFNDIGHLLGSSCIEVWLSENNIEKKIVFSGDIGNLNQPLIKDPGKVLDSDYVVVESTYGLRLHEPAGDYALNLANIIQRTFDRGGNVVIPSFAVGRTQEILYFIRDLKSRKLVTGHGEFQVVVDSPLANEATTVYMQSDVECYDGEALALFNQGINPLEFPGLRHSITTEDSMALNNITDPLVIISASGMCEAGRIRHHLKHNLWRPESTVVFVGFQGIGTTGRNLLDGAKQVRLFGEEIIVACEIVQLPGISGHADQAGLLAWLDGFTTPFKGLFVTHGEAISAQSFGAMVKERYHCPVEVPLYSMEVDLVTQAVINPGVVIEKPTAPVLDTGLYEQLLLVTQQLQQLVQQAKGRTNNDFKHLIDGITRIIRQWE